eukprot:5573554-Pyramimonas_sp.AAC.1
MHVPLSCRSACLVALLVASRTNVSCLCAFCAYPPRRSLEFMIGTSMQSIASACRSAPSGTMTTRTMSSMKAPMSMRWAVP